jgi:hypothetical protein
VKTRVQACCGKETFANEAEAQRRYDKVHQLKLAGADLPTGIRACRNGWHLTFVEQRNEPTAKVLAQVEARDGMRCVRCGKPWVKGVDSHHHRVPRGRGGTNDVENLLLLDGDGVSGCHGWVEKHRAAAYQLGYLVESGIDPGDKPVQVAGVGWRYATADGTWITRDEYAAPPGVDEDDSDPLAEIEERILAEDAHRYAAWGEG